MAPIPTQDRFVSTPDGRLFTRRWQAAASPDQQDVPLVLFHDSIGSIELWRDFPEHLMRETGRDVIAYDRLGFGQSDPLVAPLPAGFVADEARTNFKAVHDGLGIDGYVAVGHSVGGAMALGCATVYPDCRALVSIATQTYPEDRTLEGIAKARDDMGRADRRAGNVGDRIFLPGRSNPLPLRDGSAELLFLQHIRDTAHHFVIGRHRRARAGACC